MSEASTGIALFGGGRWSRVLLTELHRHMLSWEKVLWVSQTSVEDRQNFLQQAGLGSRVSLWTGADAALAKRPFATIVATEPLNHPALTTAALKAQTHVLVEKPMALDYQSAEALCDLADHQDRLLAVDLVFRTAPFLQLFAAKLHVPVSEIIIDWQDPASEIRHGSAKTPRIGTPLVWDVFPHIWSIARAIAPDADWEIISAKTTKTGTIAIEGRAENMVLRATLGRRAERRIRSVTVKGTNSATTSLDFSTEPGMIRGADETVTPQAIPSKRPLETVLSSFLSSARDGATDHALAARRNLGSVATAQQAQAALAINDTRLIGTWKAGAVAPTTLQLAEILTGHLAPLVVRRGFAGEQPYKVWDPTWTEHLAEQLPTALHPDDCVSPERLFARLHELLDGVRTPISS
ncbi:MAG: Gfo/Idh/MocA family oxidoreductase [Paracoccaceae bacterium]